jgi:formylmethanofuran--tetrahydromethanopterin N-formyltransferase
MRRHGLTVHDTFAEAFGMTAARVIVTAATPDWARAAAFAATGYGCSVIGCDAEAGIERELPPDRTPDHRPGVSLLFFAFSREALGKAVVNRVGQCVLTCPSTACFNGLPRVADKTFRVGGQLRHFGDGYQISKYLDTMRFWRIPTMDGEFLCEDEFGTVKGIAGGNFLILAATADAGLAAAAAAAEAARSVPDVILPFPGGVVRSGSKVGSKYPKLKASTNHHWCPTLRGAVADSQVPDGVAAVYEIVIDGLTRVAVEQAMRAGIDAAARPGVVAISAGNYGGKLGPHHFRLHDLWTGAD